MATGIKETQKAIIEGDGHQEVDKKAKERTWLATYIDIVNSALSGEKVRDTVVVNQGDLSTRIKEVGGKPIIETLDSADGCIISSEEMLGFQFTGAEIKNGKRTVKLCFEKELERKEITINGAGNAEELFKISVKPALSTGQPNGKPIEVFKV